MVDLSTNFILIPIIIRIFEEHRIDSMDENFLEIHEIRERGREWGGRNQKELTNTKR